MTLSLETGRIIIVGAGLGALYAALRLAPYPVLVISPESLGKGASSAWAQGGVAAAMQKPDNASKHALDTIKAGAGTVDEQVAHRVTKEAERHILALTKLGTPFDRTQKGHYVLSREAAHSFARVVRVGGDQAGQQIMEALIAEVSKTPSIQVLEGVMASGLKVKEGEVSGLYIESAQSPSKRILIQGSSYLLAGGGSGGLYKITTNPPRICGQVLGLAARAGALVSDAEFVQFHPTAIDVGQDPSPLATEALRGEGAILINKDGERFMMPLHEEAELAPRDIVARAIFNETQKGNRPLLDTRTAIGDKIKEGFPAVMSACLKAGIDPVLEPIPVAAAAHYHMGGLKTDGNGKTSLNNLWACGEVSSTGLHGANRLASNGLLEALVYAEICAENIKEAVPLSENAKEIFPHFEKADDFRDKEDLQILRNTMTEHVGVIREEKGLKKALEIFGKLAEKTPKAYENFHNMLATATLIAASALLREESRGGHFRKDFPNPHDSWAKRSDITFKEAVALRNKVLNEILEK